MISWKKIRKYLPIIGIVIFIYMLFKLDVVEIFKEIAKANLFYLMIAIIFVLIVFSFQTLKWFVIAKKQKIGVPFRDAFRINLITHFYGVITPSKLGTLIRADYLRKYTKNIGKGMCNFVLDKVLDIMSLFFLSIMFLLIFREKFSILSGGYIVIIIIAFFAFILTGLFFMKKERSRFLLKIVFKKIVPEKMKEKARVGFDSFYEDMPAKSFLIGVFLLNLITWIFIYAIIYFIGLSLGIELGFVYFLAILPISTLVAQIPITINGLGTREAVMIALFGLFGVEAVKVFSMSMLNILFTMILPSLIAIFFILKEK